MDITGWIILGALAALVIWGVSIYNGLVVLKNRYKNAWTQIDVQLKRRYDLIPNLVETAKGYLKHERETLENVIKWRNSAATASQAASKNPGDAQALGQLVSAESQLGGALGKLFALSENYPDLKANQNMMQLSEELSSTENKVAFARQAYNDSVMGYNTGLEVFPDNLVAGFFRFQPAQMWEITETQEREAVKVSF